MFDIGEIHQARYGRGQADGRRDLGVLGLVALVLVTPVVLVGNLIANRGSLLYRQRGSARNGQPVRDRASSAPCGGQRRGERLDRPRATRG